MAAAVVPWNPETGACTTLTAHEPRPEHWEPGSGNRENNGVVCKHGRTRPGLVTVTLHRRDTTVIFKQIPAQGCGNGGDCYFSDPATGQVINSSEAAMRSGAEVETPRFAD
jgi:hypothetical protein